VPTKILNAFHYRVQNIMPIFLKSVSRSAPVRPDSPKAGQQLQKQLIMTAHHGAEPHPLFPGKLIILIIHLPLVALYMCALRAAAAAINECSWAWDTIFSLGKIIFGTILALIT
jgi:hypothetical protein